MHLLHPLHAFSHEGFQRGNAVLYLLFSTVVTTLHSGEMEYGKILDRQFLLLAPPLSSSQMLNILKSLSPFLLHLYKHGDENNW